MKLLITFLFTSVIGLSQSVYGGWVTYPALIQSYQGGVLPNYYWIGVTNPNNVIPNPDPQDVVVTVNCPSESQTVILEYDARFGINMPKVLTFQRRETGCILLVRIYKATMPILVKGSE